MEAPMTRRCLALGKSPIVAGCLLLALPLCVAQNKSVQSQSAASSALISKARAQEARSRPDLAVQLWQQILLSEPNNAEALAGLARDYKLMGNTSRSSELLERLRRVNPGDPNIAKIQSLSSTQSESEQLRRAGDLARQGRAEDAVRIYRQLYGDNPPDNDIAMAYYQTLYATPNGKPSAVAGMRGLVQRNPGNERFGVALGVMLTYDPRTRSEGIQKLQGYPNDNVAQQALRQALMWNAANPSTAGQMRQYLKAHPEDSEVAGNLRANERKLAQMNTGIARTAAERAAFAALNAHRLGEAQTRFDALLRQQPNNGRVLAGIGFLRMQQRNFADAINFLSQAEQNGYKPKSVESALATSRFWAVMSEATEAFDQNRLDVASARYKAALVMNDRSPEALNGLAGVLMKQQQYAAAAGVYEQLVAAQHTSLDGWRGLFLAYAGDKQYATALATSARFPEKVNTALARDPEYLRSLAAIYQEQNRTADAERVLAQALTLPFPNNGASLKTDTKLQYAGILMQARRYSQALPLYTQAVSETPTTVSAWMGLVSAYHELGQDTQAIAELEKMPRASYESSLADPGFLSMLGAIYQQAGQYDTAQNLLERAAKIAIAAGGQPSIALQLQLAGIYLLRNNADQAYGIYQRVTASNPDRADAWKGMIGALLGANRNADALLQVAAIPGATRKQLDGDIDFEQSLASLYANTGDTAHAVIYMNRVQAYYLARKQQLPSAIEIQSAWLFYSTGDDRALYATLMRLGGRNDLSIAQRETIQNIWANWSVRRATDAMDNGNSQRAMDILDAAMQAFPDNVTVQKAVAGGYARVGRARDALKIFKALTLQDATAGDYEAAIGAALAANDRTQAEAWLRIALGRFGSDPGILSLAARYEQARGDNQRAAAYWRAALAAMPASTPTDKLAHTLVYPDQNASAPHPANGADLKQLLNPDYDASPKSTRLPSDPPYGPDPYNMPAPAVPAPAPSAGPGANPSSPNLEPLSDPRPPIHSIPSAQPANPQLFHQQSVVRFANRNFAARWSVNDAVFHPSRRGSVPQRNYWGNGAIVSPRMVRASLAQSTMENEPAQIVANPPHTMATDAYKGLISSLVGSNRNAEALAELSKIPPDARRLLESDIEFVQTVASLYLAVNDSARATPYLNRIENFYAQNRITAPAGLAIQHAWLLYNSKADAALYPLMTSLDARQDLNREQREQVATLWASWAMRRAQASIDAGNLQRGLEILEAAAQAYPDKMDVRRAVAGAYAKTGRSSDALLLFRKIPMDSASAADYEGAIGAAMGAKDMKQAEVWLRQALARFPVNPRILALAARYEEARGNKQGAIAYWRAALANMPEGSSVENLRNPTSNQTGAQRTVSPSDMKRLLDPGNQVLPPVKLPPLPSYNAQPSALPPPALRGNGTTDDASQTSYSGTVNLPPSERTILSDEPTTSDAVPAPSAAQPRASTAPAPPMRITSQPMGEKAARAQALFAAETDSQLTQGSAAVVHALPNAPVDNANAQTGATQATTDQSQVREALPGGQITYTHIGEYTAAQYTPSSQEAATGAYSVPRTQLALPPQKPAPVARQSDGIVVKRRPAPRPSRSIAQPAPTETAVVEPPAPPLSSAPAAQIPPAPVPQSQAQTIPPQPVPPSTGVSDEQLQERNLPPLSGPWKRARSPRIMSPREEAELQLRSIEGGYSGWLGGTGYINFRSGALGYDHLAALEAPFEASLPMGPYARFTVVAKPVFLDSGQADGTSLITVLKSTTTGTALASIPQPIGTLAGASFAPPAQQNAMGIGGEVQLAFPQFAIAAGYTPYGFLVSTFTGRLTWRPANGPFTITAVRDSQKDSQLSYAGLRDPAGNTLTTQGQIWGGVVYNQGNLQYAHGDAQSGFYFSVGGQYLTGYNVVKNRRIDGNAGAYWRMMRFPEYGDLNIGVNFFAMHYDKNLNAFTHGMGGYFSPQGYFLANVPFTYTGHYGTNFHFNATGGIGVQAFQQDKTKLWPLAGDQALETAQGNPMLPDLTSVGPNYDLHGQLSYQINPHWFAGGFFGANNTRNYSSASVGFSIHYMFRAQPSSASGPTGLFPSDGLRPFTVP
jgi:tetratricopeptide (TPR) repeat protein